MTAMSGPSTHEVRRIDPSERELLERLAGAEPVHPLAGDGALDRRIAPDRRVYALAAGDGRELPMTVVWVALTSGVPDRIAPLLDPRGDVVDPSSADTAVFYSIWNVVADEPGPGRGGDLIEGAAALLAEELPGLSTFVTLSPAPGLAALWEPGWPAPGEPGFADHVARALVALDDGGRPREPVARFHLGNGARLWRVNLDADASPRALEQSFGVMVNYRYAPEDRAANRVELSEGFVPVSPSVGALVAGPA